jgi:hypothetical protein
MSYLMQPYLNQRTMVLRSALVDNTATSWSVTGDGTTNTFEQAGKSKWWGNSEKFHDFEGSGTLHGKSMIKRFRLNEEKDTESNGTIFINFDIRDVNPYFMGQKNYTLKLVINDNYEVNLRTDQDRPDSGLTDGGIRWEKDDGDRHFNHGPEGLQYQDVVNYRIAMPYDVAYDTKHKDNYQNELIKVELKAIGINGSDHSFMLDNFVITEQEQNTITDEIQTHTFDVGAHDYERRHGWVGNQKEGINLSSIKKLKFGDSDETYMLVGANDTVVTQTFTRDPNRASEFNGIRIDFDMFELDSWDNEKFYITINDHEIELGTFNYKLTEEGGYDNREDWIHWKRTDYDMMQPTAGTSGHWKDQKHTYSIFVHDEFLKLSSSSYPDGFNEDELTIEFSSNLSTPLLNNTESWAIDNFQIYNHEDTKYFFKNSEVEALKDYIQGKKGDISVGDSVKEITPSEMQEGDFYQVADRISEHLKDLGGIFRQVTILADGKSFMKEAQEGAETVFSDLKNLALEAENLMNITSSRYEHYAKVLWIEADEGDGPKDSGHLIGNLIAATFAVAAVAVSAFLTAGTTAAAALPILGGIGSLSAATYALISQRTDLTDDFIETYTKQLEALENATGIFENVVEAQKMFEPAEGVNYEQFDKLLIAVDTNINRLSDMVANIQLASALVEWKELNYGGQWKEENSKSGLSFGDTYAIGNPEGKFIHTSPPGLGFDVDSTLLSRKTQEKGDRVTVTEDWRVKVQSSDEIKLMFPGDNGDFESNELVYDFRRRKYYDDNEEVFRSNHFFDYDELFS